MNAFQHSVWERAGEGEGGGDVGGGGLGVEPYITIPYSPKPYFLFPIVTFESHLFLKLDVGRSFNSNSATTKTIANVLNLP